MKYANILAITCTLMLALGSVAVQAATYSYKCPKCGLVLTYDRPGIFKCPSDGSSMVVKW